MRKLPKLCLLAATVVTIAATAAPAEAETALQITTPSCFESAGGNYTAVIDCYYSWSGGIGPYTASYGGNVGVFYDSDGGDQSHEVYAHCNVGSKAHLTVTITDSTGATATATGTTDCTALAP